MIVVYTAVFGGYDKLRPVSAVPGVRFVAFTDELTPDTDGWECLRPTKTERSNTHENRKYKCGPDRLFPSATWTIYLDANLDLIADPHRIVNECDDGLNLFRHNVRNCAYAEAAVVSKRTGESIFEQTKRYRAAGFPAGYGLFWGGFLVRTAAAAEFNAMWWAEVQNSVGRDQVSLPFVLWQWNQNQNDLSTVLPGQIPFYGGKNRFCVRRPHVVERSARNYYRRGGILR